MIQDEDRPIKVSTPEMVDLVNALILADRRVTLEVISEKLGISVGTTRKLCMDDLALF